MLRQQILILSAFIIGCTTISTAQITTEQLPHQDYKELSNPIKVNRVQWNNHHQVNMSWGSTDIRYKKEAPAPIAEIKKEIELEAWRGERVSAQWVFSAYDKSARLSYKVLPLTHDKDNAVTIDTDHILSGFVRYVMTDELNKGGKGACGHRKKADFDSTLVADVIDPHIQSITVNKHNTRPGWIQIWVPQNAQPGTYNGGVEIYLNGQLKKTLKLSLSVNQHQLPKPTDWKFHLDLWQNPYAVARYYDVEPWSAKHFEYLKLSMKNYAEAGGDVITTSIIHKPWDGQTYDDFETMVTWMKRADGSWYFDYTIFDQWVQFMMDLGVDKQINCYSMIPWKLSFQYYDQATNSLRFFEAKPGEPEYTAFWTRMLKSFAAHLKEKGWFTKTYIAMDERPLEAMQAAIKVIREADPNFKIALAGNWHPELSADIDDYCVTYDQTFSEDLLEERHKSGKISTFYTSCAHPYPNSFTFSNPAESEWLGWHAAAENLDGFLRWAYNSWVKAPMQDSRFITWAAGDTYLDYPGARPSIRLVKLVDGIEDYEKIHLLKKEWQANNNKRKIRKLNKILENFEKLNPEDQTASEVIKEAKKDLRRLY